MEQFHHFLDQSRLYVDYVEGLYNVLDRIQEKYSDLMMMCSGGGVKFRTNVAMMGKLGFDIKLDDMSAEEADYCKRAIRNYNALKPIILEGDQYRLVSPYEGEHAATMYVGKNDGNAVVFTFDLYPRYKQQIFKSEANLKMEGLNPSARYRVTEIDRTDGKDREVGEYSGEYLMRVGLPLFTLNRLNSSVFTVNKI